MSPEATFCLGLTVFPTALCLFVFLASFSEERPKLGTPPRPLQHRTPALTEDDRVRAAWLGIKR